MNLYHRSSGVAPDRFDTFFKWAPDEAFGMGASSQDEKTQVALLQVTEDLTDAFVGDAADMEAHYEIPALGWYVLLFDHNDNVVYAHVYGEDRDSAVADLREDPAAADMFYGEEPYDPADRHAETPVEVLVKDVIVLTHKIHAGTEATYDVEDLRDERAAVVAEIVRRAGA